MMKKISCLCYKKCLTIVLVLTVISSFSGCTPNENPQAIDGNNSTEQRNETPNEIINDIPIPPEESEQPNIISDAPQNTVDDLPVSGAVQNPTNINQGTSFINSEGNNIETRINPPKGYQRIPSKTGELTNFIRSLPLKEDGSKVLLYNGRSKMDQASHVAVFDFDIGSRDLLQCADSIIKIYAEYYWSLGQFDKIEFHLTSGFLMEYTKWRDGNRISVNGNKVTWNKTRNYDASYENFQNYLNMVYAYAGTLSLNAESKPIELDQLKPGDMFLQGGSPGHCVLVVDIAEDEQGNRCFLLAQGFMPAQDFHIIINPLNPENPWFYVSDIAYPFKTPSWTFEAGSLKRWADFTLEAMQ